MTLLCFVTCASAAEARKIAKSVLKKRLAACANILPKIESHYWWKGRLEKNSEAMLVLKTRKALQGMVESEIKKLHSYELPAIEFLKAKADPRVEEWVKRETKS